jgi:integrase
MGEGNLRRRHFADLVKRANLSGNLSPYVLRHTCATLALKAGVQVLVVAERLGHANANLVLSTYGHTLEGQQVEAAERLGAVLFAPRSLE